MSRISDINYNQLQPIWSTHKFIEIYDRIMQASTQHDALEELNEKKENTIELKKDEMKYFSLNCTNKCTPLKLFITYNNSSLISVYTSTINRKPKNKKCLEQVDITNKSYLIILFKLSDEKFPVNKIYISFQSHMNCQIRLIVKFGKGNAQIEGKITKYKLKIFKTLRKETGTVKESNFDFKSYLNDNESNTKGFKVLPKIKSFSKNILYNSVSESYNQFLLGRSESHQENEIRINNIQKFNIESEKLRITKKLALFHKWKFIRKKVKLIRKK